MSQVSYGKSARERRYS